VNSEFSAKTMTPQNIKVKDICESLLLLIP